jgi:hypothetical protein
VTIVNRFQAMPSSIPVGATRSWPSMRPSHGAVEDAARDRRMCFVTPSGSGAEWTTAAPWNSLPTRVRCGASPEGASSRPAS